MKKIFALSLLVGVLACFTSCDKDKDNDVNGQMGYLTIDGKSHEITDCGLWFVEYSDADETEIVLYGTTGDFYLSDDVDPQGDGNGCLFGIYLLTDGLLEELPAGTYADQVEAYLWEVTAEDAIEEVCVSKSLNVERSGSTYTIRYAGTSESGKQVTFNWSGTPKMVIDIYN